MSARKRKPDETFADYRAAMARDTTVEKAKHSLGNGRATKKVRQLYTEHQAKEVLAAVDVPEEGK